MSRALTKAPCPVYLQHPVQPGQCTSHTGLQAWPPAPNLHRDGPFFPVPYCDIPILSVPDPLSLPSIHGTFNSQGGKNLLPQCFLVADAQSIGVNEVYSHSGHQPIPWTGALSLHTLTVTLKVMAFCRPSGEICSSSATVRISVALTTVAISWQSVCRTQSDGTGHSLCMHPKSGQKSSAPGWLTYLVFLKVDVSQVKDRGEDAEDAVLLIHTEAQHLHGVEQPTEILCIILAGDLTVPTLPQPPSAVSTPRLQGVWHRGTP